MPEFGDSAHHQAAEIWPLVAASDQLSAGLVLPAAAEGQLCCCWAESFAWDSCSYFFK